MVRESGDRTQGTGLNSKRNRPDAKAVAVAKRLAKSITSRCLHHTGLLTLIARRSGAITVERQPGSFLPLVRRSVSPKFGILCYHRIGSEGVPYHSQLAPAVFESQIRYLKRCYRVVSLSQLFEELRASADVPATIAVTFDDGYRDVYTYALPILRKYDVPATIYLIGQAMQSGAAPWYDRIFAAVVVWPEQRLALRLNETTVFELGSPADRLSAAWQIVCHLRSVSDAERKRWCQDFESIVSVPDGKLNDRMLTWTQVYEMQRQGISFGAHTMTHPSVAQLAPGDFQTELFDSKRLLESHLDSAVRHFAFPFGKPNDRSAAAEDYLRQCGFLTAVTTTEGFNTPQTNPLRLNRLQIGGERSLAAFAFDLARMFLEQPSQADELEKQFMRDASIQPASARFAP